LKARDDREATMTRMQRRRWVAGGLLAVQGAVLAVSCSAGIGEQDCLQLADALGNVEKDRCGGGNAGYTTVYQATINGAANGNCANITSVRDHVALVDACTPCLLDADCYDAATFCTDLDAAVLPAACLEQLQL
jgi:hypothetical protein